MVSAKQDFQRDAAGLPLLARLGRSPLGGLAEGVTRLSS